MLETETAEGNSDTTLPATLHALMGADVLGGSHWPLSTMRHMQQIVMQHPTGYRPALRAAGLWFGPPGRDTKVTTKLLAVGNVDLADELDGSGSPKPSTDITVATFYLTAPGQSSALMAFLFPRAPVYGPDGAPLTQAIQVGVEPLR